MKKENGGLPCLAKKMSTDAPASVDLEEFTEYLHSTRNDLQDPAITVQPVISDAISALEAGGASFARMSGSGATCFGIFSDPVSVGNARAAIVAAHPDWWVR